MSRRPVTTQNYRNLNYVALVSIHYENSHDRHVNIVEGRKLKQYKGGVGSRAWCSCYVSLNHANPFRSY